MIRSILNPAKIIVPFIAIALSYTSEAQYYYANDKDNTRPEVERLFKIPPKINTFHVFRNNGYIEVQWSATANMDGHRFIAEYSRDGVIYETAGEGIVTNGVYHVRHHTFEVNPMLYRIRSQGTDGKFFYSGNILLDGVDISPVTVFPTTVTGSAINLRSVFAMERATIVSSSGKQVYTEDIGGRRDQVMLNIPKLTPGIYFVNITGTGWKSSAKFIVP